MVLKLPKIAYTSTVECRFTETFYLLLKCYLSLVYHISLDIEHPQSVSPTFLALFLN